LHYSGLYLDEEILVVDGARLAKVLAVHPRANRSDRVRAVASIRPPQIRIVVVTGRSTP
jgi:hypothetical protein